MNDITEKIDIILSGKRRVDEESIHIIMELMCISNMSQDELNEGIGSSISNLKQKFDTALKALGISGHKNGSGLIEMANKISENLALCIYYAIQASLGNKSAKEELIEILKSIKKEEVLDLLLKLDGITMHFLTGPIHMIDYLTGWHIWATIKSHAESGYKKVVTVIKDLISIAHTTPSPDVKTATKDFVNKISDFFGLDQFRMA